MIKAFLRGFVLTLSAVSFVFGALVSVVSFLMWDTEILKNGAELFRVAVVIAVIGGIASLLAEYYSITDTE